MALAAPAIAPQVYGLYTEEVQRLKVGHPVTVSTASPPSAAATCRCPLRPRPGTFSSLPARAVRVCILPAWRTQAVALDPRYATRKTRELVYGTAAGSLVLSSKVRPFARAGT